MKIKKFDYSAVKEDIFYKIIYPIYAKEFLYGDNYENFAFIVSANFILNSEQWGYILEHWEQKENILKEEIVEEVKEETLLDKAKRLYPVGTKFKSAYSGEVFTIKNHIQEPSNPTSILFGTNETNDGGRYYACVYYNDKFAEIIK